MEGLKIECGIALGSNWGLREDNLRAAAAALREIDAAVEFSPVYETEPVDCPEGAGAFLNAAAVLRWAGPEAALLHVLRGIEAALGRPMTRARNAPRAMDLDILYAGGRISAGPELILPHPRLHERRFVLTPLCDLRPGLVLPGFQKSAAELLAALPVDGPGPVQLPGFSW